MLSKVGCFEFLDAGLLTYMYKPGNRNFRLWSWKTPKPSSMLSTGKKKLWNELNFSDTAVACFPFQLKLFRYVWKMFPLSIWPIHVWVFTRFYQFQAFHGEYLSFHFKFWCARKKGNKWYSSSSDGHFHCDNRMFQWSHVIHHWPL